jgi:acyl carrier protein
MVATLLNSAAGGIGKSMTHGQALKWIADIFEEPVEAIKPETLRSDIKAWDSLGTLTLMARLDEDCGILLTADDILQFKAVGDLLDMMKRHGQLM